MSSSPISPSIFKEILPSLVATTVALDAFTLVAPLSFISSNDGDLIARTLIADEIDGDNDNGGHVNNRRGKDSRNKSRAFDYDLLYFLVNWHWIGPQPLSDDRQFERFFRITRRYFEILMQELPKKYKKFDEKACAGYIKPQVRLIAVLNFLAYETSYN